jgi:hypothetical protein
MRCDYCGVEQSAVLGTTRTHCAPPFDRRRHAFTGKHPADAKRLAELDDMQASGRERLRGKFRALAMDTKLMSYDRDVMRQLIMLSDAALDALSLAIRG